MFDQKEADLDNLFPDDAGQQKVNDPKGIATEERQDQCGQG